MNRRSFFRAAFAAVTALVLRPKPGRARGGYIPRDQRYVTSDPGFVFPLMVPFTIGEETARGPEQTGASVYLPAVGK